VHTFLIVLALIGILAMSVVRGIIMRRAWRNQEARDPDNQTALHRFQMHLRHGWWVLLLAGVGLTAYNVVHHNPYRIGGPGTMYLGVGLIAAGVVGGTTLLRMRNSQSTEVYNSGSASHS
jgi:hypothetical protein